MPRALSIYLPRWAIRLALRRRLLSAPRQTQAAADSHKGAALLLVSSYHGSEVAACVCERGEAAGVRAGMTVAQARSLLRGREVVVEPYRPDEDARRLRGLARWALRFSPIAAPDDPDGLLLDIAGCAHLFGGEAGLAERVADSLEQFGFDPRMAIAPTLACAQAVARCAERRITIVAEGDERAAVAPLPVTALRVEAATCAALAEVGVERIGQLVDLPRGDLAARFGDGLLRRMDEVMGRGAYTVIEAIRPIEPLEVSRAFDGPVTCLETVQIASRELLSILVRQLGRQESGVCLLRFAFRRIDAGPVSMTLGLTHPSRNEAHLWALLRPRIERLHLGYGVEDICLRAARTERVGHEQIGLFSDYRLSIADDPVADARGSLGRVKPALRTDAGSSVWPMEPAIRTALGRLLDEFIERFGSESVNAVALLETYVPERAFVLRPRTYWQGDGVGHAPTRLQRLEPGGARIASGRSAANWYAPARPTRLFWRPEPIRAMTLTPDGPPAWIQRRARGLKVRRWVGPERIAMPWWDWRLSIVDLGSDEPRSHGATKQRRDGGAERRGHKGTGEWLAAGCGSAARDYYTIEDECSNWLWVFRDSVTGLWFVHGEWA